MEFAKRELRKNFWAIEQQGVRSFLLVGADNALLIDTCFGGDILSICEEITDKPIILLTTHADPDHTGCDNQFATQYLHPAEFECYERRNKRSPKTLPMVEGDVFTAGDYSLEVISIPGHTPGSVAFLDQKNKFLISGDSVQNGSIYMFGEFRNLSDYLSSLNKLERMRAIGRFDAVYASHGDAEISADIIPDHINLAENLLSKAPLPSSPAPEWIPVEVRNYRFGKAQMYY